MANSIVGWCVAVMVVGQVCCTPVAYSESHPLTVVSDLGQRLASHSRFQDSASTSGDPRLGLPSPQEIEAIKKVAQILVMLGEQVIPTIIGDSIPPAHANCDTVPVEDVPNDTVNEK